MPMAVPLERRALLSQTATPVAIPSGSPAGSAVPVVAALEEQAQAAIKDRVRLPLDARPAHAFAASPAHPAIKDRIHISLDGIKD
jgi:hypothetical protein